MKKLAFCPILALTAIFCSPAFAQTTGPSTTTAPYLLPARSGVTTTSILTVGDSIGGYRLVGAPDGTGAWVQDASTFNWVVHHEFGKTAGAVRAHGSTGAFVSRWLLNRSTLAVSTGRDHNTAATDVFTWNGSAYTAGTTAWERFCSADLPMPGAFGVTEGGLGTSERIFMGGEETSPPFTGDHGRAFAHIVTGSNINKTYELPRLGKMSFENVVASPYLQDKTVVMLADDASVDTNVTLATVCKTAGQTGCASPSSEVYVYVGTKQATGNEVERAGLTNGNFYGVRVKVGETVVTGENKDFVFSSAAPAVTSARFELYNFGDVSTKTGVEIQDEALTNQVTQFMRVEDGAWDPRPGKQRDYYFVTTGRIFSSASSWRPSRLWRLRFDDITNPAAGGVIDMMLTNQFYSGAATTPDQDPSYQMFDNLTIDGLGRIILQEDVGGNARLGRIYLYSIDTGKLVQVAAYDPKFFSGTAGTNPDFLTNDEEASGVIDASEILGDGWFLMAPQVHKASADAELVEGGQLLAMFIDPKIGELTVAHDFDGAGKSDIAWRHTDGTLAASLMNSAQIAQAGSFGVVPTTWQVVGQRDFNGDNSHDLLWRDSTTGTIAIWLLNGFQVSQSGSLGAVGPNWSVADTGDFNGDGKGDILWRDSNTGTVAVWLLDGLVVSQSGSLGSLTSDWVIVGGGDFNGDGKRDILWRNTFSGTLGIWLVNGLQVVQGGTLGSVPGTWIVSGTGDFDGNGKSDILWRDNATGTVAVWLLNGLQIAQTGSFGPVASDWVIAQTGDFGGNGRSDILWRNSTGGLVAMWFLDGLTLPSTGSVGTVNADWTIQGTNVN